MNVTCKYFSTILHVFFKKSYIYLIIMNLRTKIETLISARGITIKALARKIPVAEQTLHRNMNRNSMELKHLLKIAQILDVNPVYFFEETDKLEEDPKPYGLKSSTTDDKYTECLEEIRDLNKENRELREKIRKMKEEMGKKKTPCPEVEQKNNGWEVTGHRLGKIVIVKVRLYCKYSIYDHLKNSENEKI